MVLLVKIVKSSTVVTKYLNIISGFPTSNSYVNGNKGGTKRAILGWGVILSI